MQEKYAARKAKDPSVDLPKRMAVHEIKATVAPPNKLQVTNITWGPAKSDILGATFRHKPKDDFQTIFIVWNYIECAKLCHIDLGDLTVASITINPFDLNTLLVSGDQGYLLKVKYGNPNPVAPAQDSLIQITQKEERKESTVNPNTEKRQHSRQSNRSYNQLVYALSASKFVLVSNTTKQLYMFSWEPSQNKQQSYLLPQAFTLLSEYKLDQP